MSGTENIYGNSRNGASTRRPTERTFLILYTLAFGGVFLSFIPFFSFLLPLKVEAITPSDKVALLSRVTVAGAIVASIANIVFGALSDSTRRRTGTRRPWILAGLAGTMCAYAAVGVSTSEPALVASVCALQIAINMMLGPLVAIMADEVADERKGIVAAILSLAHPFSTILGVFAMMVADAEHLRFGAICILLAILILPLCLRGRESGSILVPQAQRLRASSLRNLGLLWAARLLVQGAGAAVATYIFLYLEDVWRLSDGTFTQSAIARYTAITIAAVTLLAILLTLIVGRLSDRRMQRKPMIIAAALCMATGLACLANPASLAFTIISYALFAVGYPIFIALLSAFAMELLPSPDHRGRDLGIFNLTNTLPTLAVPLVLLNIGATSDHLGPVFAILASLAALAGLILLWVREDRALKTEQMEPASP